MVFGRSKKAISDANREETKQAIEQLKIDTVLDALRQTTFLAETLWHLKGNDEARKYAEIGRAAIKQAMGE